jgi:hypothetical protein
MKDTIPDKFGRQHCPHCKSILEFYGPWRYNSGTPQNEFCIVIGEWSFRCENLSCGRGFCASTEETIKHLKGVQIVKEFQEAKKKLKDLSK